jgi:hypothetical protein
VITVPPGVRILLAARPVDFRKGMDGLAALVGLGPARDHALERLLPWAWKAERLKEGCRQCLNAVTA